MKVYIVVNTWASYVEAVYDSYSKAKSLKEKLEKHNPNHLSDEWEIITREVREDNKK